MIALEDLQQVPHEDWDQTQIGEVLQSHVRLTTTSSGARLTDAFRKIAEEDLERLPVVSNGRLIGILSLGDVVRYLQLRAVMGPHDVRHKTAGPKQNAA